MKKNKLLVTEADKAREVLEWQSSHNSEKMCKDAWEAIQNDYK